MVRGEVIKAIKFFKESLIKHGIKVDKLIVFGSQARGTARKDRDIDIIVISRDFEGKDLFTRAKITGDAHWEVMKEVLIPLDIMSLTPEEFESPNSLLSEFDKEGEVIFT